MIAELAAFNAAFGVVKAAINNGRDIASCAQHIGEMIGAEEALQKRGAKKKNSIWASLAGKDTNDFEEFMALEKIKEQRKELLSSLQLYGRAGLKDDFLKFEIEARKKRREDEAKRKENRQKTVEWIVGILLFLAMAGVGSFFVYLIGLDRGYW